MLCSESFGNPTRIDYGTGHEFKFCAFLCCLMKLGVIPRANAAAVALKVVAKYVKAVFQSCVSIHALSLQVPGFDEENADPVPHGASREPWGLGLG